MIAFERRSPWVPVFIATAVLTFIAIAVSATVGAYTIPLNDVLRVIGSRVFPFIGNNVDQLSTEVLNNIRLPRIALGFIVGAALGSAGAVMQGAFNNPLAEPGIIGVSTGAMAASAAQISLGITIFGRWSLPVAAFFGGLVAVLLVYRAARFQGRVETLTLVLLGIALNAINGAIIGFFAYISDETEIRSLTAWTMGSVGQATWSKVFVILPLLVIGVAGALRLGNALDIMSLGDRPARHLGINVDRMRFFILLIVACLTAAAVAMSGVIVFVGLVVPHVVRLLIGPRHRPLIIVSCIVGAFLIVVADTFARIIVSPSELPLGVVTAVIGGPVFIWQLIGLRNSMGGVR